MSASTLSKPHPARPSDDSELTDDDVIIRYDKQEKVVGLTILHVSKRQRLESDRSNQEMTKIVSGRKRGQFVRVINREQPPRASRTRTKPSS